MLYRKDLVEDAGYDPDGENWATEPMQWQRFSEIVADVQEQSGLQYGYVFQADSYEGLSCCNFNEFMTSWGGAYFGGMENLFGPVGDRPITVADEQVADSIRMVRTFIHGEDDEEALDGYTGGIAPEAVTNWTEQESNGAFDNGDAAFMRNWPFFVGQHGADDGYGEDLGVMPIPSAVGEDEAEYPGTGGTAAALGGWHVAVNPNTQYMDAAMEAVTAAASDEFNYAIMEILGQIPPKPGLLDTGRARQVPVTGRYLDTFRVAGENAIPRPVTVVWPDESRQIHQEVNAAFSQQKGPEEALSDLESALEQIEQSA
jgi:ABC-type glycerol-3-phosphate transport system substrate-binding protein